MMDEQSDPSRVELFPILFPTFRHVHDPPAEFFYLQTEGLFAVQIHCVRQKAPNVLQPHPPPILLCIILSVYVVLFSVEKLIIDVDNRTQCV